MTDTTAPLARNALGTTTFAIIAAVSFCHMLNDVLQSMLSAIYPMLKENYGLDFWQIGLLTLTFQVTASLLQPVIGLVIDKRPMPYSLPVGMGSSLVGLLLLSVAHSYPMLLVGAALIGIGSAVFHPESSRVARTASGGRYGMAQSFFQVGGNFGQAIGPLLAAFIIVPRGQGSIAWFALAALVGIFVLYRVGRWYEQKRRAAVARGPVSAAMPLSRQRTTAILIVLMLLTFTKNIYTAAFSSYYTFFTMERFGLSIESAQIMLFLFLGAFALGTVLGGPIGDRIGTKAVIWFSILGALPFTLLLPYVSLFWTGVLVLPIGLILASAFPAIVVFAQELVPGKVGMISGLFFGFSFGMGGLGAAALGWLADTTSIETVYQICAFLPAIGLLTALLPNIEREGDPAPR